MIFNYYVSQQHYSWDCDVRHNRHLDLKIRVLTQRDFGDALQEAVDIFGRENKDADELIAKTRQEIHELKNRQTLTENVLKNLLCTCHGKPVVMCLGIEGV